MAHSEKHVVGLCPGEPVLDTGHHLAKPPEKGPVRGGVLALRPAIWEGEPASDPPSEASLRETSRRGCSAAGACSRASGELRVGGQSGVPGGQGPQREQS